MRIETKVLGYDTENLRWLLGNLRARDEEAE